MRTRKIWGDQAYHSTPPPTPKVKWLIIASNRGRRWRKLNNVSRSWNPTRVNITQAHTHDQRTRLPADLPRGWCGYSGIDLSRALIAYLCALVGVRASAYSCSTRRDVTGLGWVLGRVVLQERGAWCFKYWLRYLSRTISGSGNEVDQFRPLP